MEQQILRVHKNFWIDEYKFLWRDKEIHGVALHNRLGRAIYWYTYDNGLFTHCIGRTKVPPGLIAAFKLYCLKDRMRLHG